MASAAPQQQLPLLYDDIQPLSSQQHASYRLQRKDKAPFLSEVHAVPVTIDEFVMVQRFMPIVFSVGENPVPLALMGLNAGVNVFIDEEGGLREPNTYMPAYVRRYPFLLARLNPDTEELSLCFDPTCDVLGDFDEGDALFEEGEPTQVVKDVLGFCEQVENSGQRTAAFVEELKKADLLMDGEVSIQVDGSDRPFTYRGFKMVNEEKLKEIRGDTARKFVQNGLLALVYAHLMSLSLVRDVFGRQVAQGKLPQPDAQAQVPDPQV